MHRNPRFCLTDPTFCGKIESCKVPVSIDWTAIRALFFFLAYSGVVYAAGSKKKKAKKKHTEHERVQLWGTTEHERGALHARHTAKTHTEHERVQF